MKPEDSRSQEGKALDPNKSVDLAELEQITDDFLDFSALDEGIGFHPKNRETKVKGSESAKQSSESGPTRRTPSQSELRTDLSKRKADRINQIKQSQTRNLETVAQKTKANLGPDKADQSSTTNLNNIAGLGSRVLASLLDLTIVNVPISAVFFVACASTPDLLSSWQLIVGLQVFLTFAYFVFTESLGGQSLGKFFMKIQVRENDRFQKPIGLEQAFVRSLVWLVFLVPTIALSFFIFWRSNYIAWHDKVSRSIVTRANV